VSTTAEPGDHQIAFFLQVYRDHDLAAACLRRLRRVYPSARVDVVSDGDDDPRYPALARRFGASFTRGERLYALACGGRLHQRMLDAFLAAPVPWLFKIDPDSALHRRFRHAPDACAVFGTLERRTEGSGTVLDPPSVQGGVVGFTLEAARRLRDSGIFLSRELLDPERSWACCPDMVRRAGLGLVSFDFILRWACMRLEVPMVDYDEVRSMWREEVRNPGLRYAATHPHKRVPRWDRLRLAWSGLLRARASGQR